VNALFYFLCKIWYNKLEKNQADTNEKHTPINEMFTYGISNSCIHLHLPGDLHHLLEKNGISKTIDTVNLNLLDAINRIKHLKDSGFYKFSNIDSIYMISPILLGRELKFLESMDFKTNSYKKRELQDDKFVVEHPEARLATHIFGNNKNIGTASIKFETINTPDWQEKCKSKISEFNERGIFLTQEKDK